MNKNLVKFTAVVIVLAVALIAGQPALQAAPNRGTAVAAERSTGIGIFDAVLRILGLIRGDVAATAPRSTTGSINVTPSAPGSTITSKPGATISPNSAIWGGDGRRCTAPPCI